MSDLEHYQAVAEFGAFLRRPAPRADGWVAQLWAPNGPDADAIIALGRSDLQDALVHVVVTTEEGEGGGFEGYVRRPRPYVSGMVAQFHANNGVQADIVVALGLSKYLDKRARVTVRLVQNPDGLDQAKRRVPKGPYSDLAQVLWKSKFFRTPAVWKALGSDEDYAGYIQTQACIACGETDWVEEIGEGRCEAAHVNRPDRAGMAIKADYSRVPLCHMHHVPTQHQHGLRTLYEGYLAWKGKPIEGDERERIEAAREWFDRERIRYVQQWAWQTMARHLNVSSMTAAAPETVYEWARARKVEWYLPAQYHPGRDGS